MVDVEEAASASALPFRSDYQGIQMRMSVWLMPRSQSERRKFPKVTLRELKSFRGSNKYKKVARSRSRTLIEETLNIISFGKAIVRFREAIPIVS